MDGTDQNTQSRYTEALDAAGYQVHDVSMSAPRSLSSNRSWAAGLEALSPEDLPGDRRDAVAAHIARALPIDTPFMQSESSLSSVPHADPTGGSVTQIIRWTVAAATVVAGTSAQQTELVAIRIRENDQCVVRLVRPHRCAKSPQPSNT